MFFNGYDIFLARSDRRFSPRCSPTRGSGASRSMFDPSSFALIQAYGVGRLLDGVGPLDVLIANDAEADALREGRPLAALEAYATLVVVKQGARRRVRVREAARRGTPRRVPSRSSTPPAPATRSTRRSSSSG